RAAEREEEGQVNLVISGAITNNNVTDRALPLLMAIIEGHGKMERKILMPPADKVNSTDKVAFEYAITPAPDYAERVTLTFTESAEEFSDTDQKAEADHEDNDDASHDDPEKQDDEHESEHGSHHD